FCNLVHSAIVIGTKAFAIFTDLDTQQKGELLPKELKNTIGFSLDPSVYPPHKPIDFCQFLLAYAGQQTRLGPQVGMTNAVAVGGGGGGGSGAGGSAVG